MPVLANCPCGNVAITEIVDSRYRIACAVCPIKTETYPTANEARYMWEAKQEPNGTPLHPINGETQ